MAATMCRANLWIEGKMLKDINKDVLTYNTTNTESCLSSSSQGLSPTSSIFKYTEVSVGFETFFRFRASREIIHSQIFTTASPVQLLTYQQLCACEFLLPHVHTARSIHRIALTKPLSEDGSERGSHLQTLETRRKVKL